MLSHSRAREAIHSRKHQKGRTDMRAILLIVAAFAAAACAPTGELPTPETADQPIYAVAKPGQKIKIVGSSTVAPFSIAVAEQFGATTPFATPIVESTGTGGGFKAFCKAIGPKEPSIANASRQIKPSESALCAEAGIVDIIALKIGFDGIVLANARAAPELDLNKGDIYRALAAELPDGNGGWQSNPYRSWREVNASLPDMDIIVSGPPPTSGTRDAFAEIAMEQGALQLPELAALKKNDPAAFKRRAHTIRNDGAWIDSGENDSSIVQTLLKSDESLGIMGYSFLEQNLDRVKGARIGGVAPVFEEIASGNYTVSRSMYVYIKGENLPLVPGIREFIAEFTHEDSWGPYGYLADKGLIPLEDETRSAVRTEVMARLHSRPGDE